MDPINNDTILVLYKKRFMMKIVKKNECWLWKAGKFKEGYGAIKWPTDNQNRGAHVVALKIFKGINVPSEKIVRHLCNIKHCVNPKHLRVGTYSENLIDAYRNGRLSRTTKLTPSDVRK